MVCEIVFEDVVLKWQKSICTCNHGVNYIFGKRIGNELTACGFIILESIQNPILRNISNHLLELGNQLVVRVRKVSFKERTTGNEFICLSEKLQQTIGRMGLEY